MTDWAGFLTEDERRELRDLLVRAGFDTPQKIDYLLSSLPPTYRARLEGWNLNPAQQLNRQLRQMNTVVAVRGSGLRPLQALLKAALEEVEETAEIEALERLLEKVASAGPAADQAAVAAPRPAAAPSDLAAVANIDDEALIGGRDDTVPVAFLSEGAQAARSVFKIVVQRHFEGEPAYVNENESGEVPGTGWVIAPGLAITNYHVVEARNRAAEEPAASVTDFRLQAETARLKFDFIDAAEEPEGVAPGAGALLAQGLPDGLDYAVLRLPSVLENRPALRVAPTCLKKRLEQALGPCVNVLQHPEGAPMRLGFRTNYVILGDDKMVAYLTDTTHGSSGSPVLDDRWRVVALHRGSRPISQRNIRILSQLIRRENVGSQIQAILHELKLKHPALHDEIRDGQAALTS